MRTIIGSLRSIQDLQRILKKSTGQFSTDNNFPENREFLKKHWEEVLKTTTEFGFSIFEKENGKIIFTKK
ncbi:MAG: hypothetical protein V1851_00255 [Patescibacteria group bacterium]